MQVDPGMRTMWLDGFAGNCFGKGWAKGNKQRRSQKQRKAPDPAWMVCGPERSLEKGLLGQVLPERALELSAKTVSCSLGPSVFREMGLCRFFLHKQNCIKERRDSITNSSPQLEQPSRPQTFLASHLGLKAWHWC